MDRDPDTVWWRCLRVRTRAALLALFRPTRIAGFLFALTAILASFARHDVRAADAVLKPWTEGRLPLRRSQRAPCRPGARCQLARARSLRHSRRAIEVRLQKPRRKFGGDHQSAALPLGSFSRRLRLGPVDAADVRKVVLEEPPKNLAIDDPKVVAARKALFGAWEGNWLAYNFAHDVALAGSKRQRVAFLMYPAGRVRKRAARLSRSRNLQIHDYRKGADVSLAQVSRRHTTR